MIKISRRLQKAGKKAIVVLAVLISILALMAGILVYKVTEQKKYNKQLSLGEKYLAELDYENAELCFLSAIEINDRKLKPYVALCNTYIGRGKFETKR